MGVRRMEPILAQALEQEALVQLPLPTPAGRIARLLLSSPMPLEDTHERNNRVLPNGEIGG